MAYINHKDLEALNALLADNLIAWEGEEDSVKEEHAELIERLQQLDLSAVNDHADEDLIERARSIYQAGHGPFADEIEIDDYAVGVSRGDDGTWVNAWVWVRNDDDEDDYDDLQDCQVGLTGGNA